MKLEELGIPIPAVEGQLLGTLREILRDVERVWKSESRVSRLGATQAASSKANPIHTKNYVEALWCHWKGALASPNSQP